MRKIKESSTHFANKNSLGDICPEIYAINLLSGQWTLAICCHLSNGKLRFGELKKRIPQVTERMLALQLRKMEEDQLVIRTVYPEVPPRVEYELTESGMELIPIFKQLEAWGERHKSRL
ncbi:winged helix-turn-helix transcriptional regulator [Chitinophaga flava]|uniref:Transcriptional regulator n=1 Tax=Chitinophaga flava TaxID=2259036 RepID=A0A365XZD2_9BACT|nr:helix-turn-helix domain-containing protein [Chitinophaga flava]RBL91746.1 transcriptional regulator [Chitinophaga flava]